MTEEPIPFALPDITAREIAAVQSVLESKWITTGPRTVEFERRFAESVGAAHAVALNSCTAALHLSLEALGIRPGDLVYMSPYTFAATGEVVRYFDATPALVDVEPETLNIDPTLLAEQVEADVAMGGRPAAVIPVHFAGIPCDMESIWGIARRYGLAVIEDAAHAFPATRDGRTTGSMPPGLSSTACFSFYATKTLTTGEGGMVVTNDESVAERIRTMSLHGLSKQAWGRYETGGSWRYDIIAPGYKYNLTDIASAMGLVQLDRAEEMRSRRAAIAAVYDDAFGAHTLLETPVVPTGVDSAWHLYPLRLHPSGSIDRDGLIASLTDRGIGTSVHFIPLHMHTYYRATYGYRDDDFPIAAREFRRTLSLPIFSGMTESQVSRVAEAVLEAVVC